MPNSFHSMFDRRRYRLAQVAIVVGSLATGLLLVTRLYELFRDDFLSYYGVGTPTASQLDQVHLPVTMGPLLVAAMALVGVFWFVGSERRRVRDTCALDAAASCASSHVVVERPSGAALFDTLVTRTSAFGGVLLAAWLLQTSFERRLGGFGWGIEYSGWRSLLPLASVFGLCVLVGILVASISLVGLRAISVLELVLRRIASRWGRGEARTPRPRRGFQHVERTVRELLGCDILSRPPPRTRASALAFAH